MFCLQVWNLTYSAWRAIGGMSKTLEEAKSAMTGPGRFRVLDKDGNVAWQGVA